MGWTRLQPDADARESTLQGLFDQWTARGEFLLAGMPSWLANLKSRDAEPERAWHKSRGYSWQADAELDGPNNSRWIVELKHAAKWEPQALAEVLHHVQVLEERDGERVEPSIVSSYNCWLRMAIWYLRKRNLVVHYCEGYVLEDPRRATQRRSEQLIWFDDPFANYTTIGSAPKVLPEKLRKLKWTVSQDGQVWRTVRRPQTTKPGCPFIEGKYAQLATVTDGGCLLWLGEGAADQSSRADAKALLDRYFVNRGPGPDATELAPTIDLWLNDDAAQ